MNRLTHGLTDNEDRILGAFEKGMLYPSDINFEGSEDISDYDLQDALLNMTAKGLVRRVSGEGGLHYTLTEAGQQLWDKRASEES